MSGTYVATPNEIKRIDDAGSISWSNGVDPRIHYVTALRGGQTDLGLPLGEIEIRGSKGTLIDALRIIDDSVQDVQLIQRPAGTEVFVKQNQMLLPISMASDGLKNLAQILSYVMVAGDGIVLIDEIENGLHYSTYGEVWGALDRVSKETGCQIIATTHSYEFMLDAAEASRESEFVNDFCYYRLEKGAFGNKAIRYSTDDLQKSAYYEFEVR